MLSHEQLVLYESLYTNSIKTYATKIKQEILKRSFIF